MCPVLDGAMLILRLSPQEMLGPAFCVQMSSISPIVGSVPARILWLMRSRMVGFPDFILSSS